MLLWRQWDAKICKTLMAVAMIEVQSLVSCAMKLFVVCNNIWALVCATNASTDFGSKVRSCMRWRTLAEVYCFSCRNSMRMDSAIKFVAANSKTDALGSAVTHFSLTSYIFLCIGCMYVFAEMGL